MEVAVEEFESQVLRRGKKGRPPLEDHSTLTMRMSVKVHTQIVDYCVEHDISQRGFTEAAGARLLSNPKGSVKLIRRRRVAPEATDTRMVTLRMNQRLKDALVAFCLEGDVSQREAVELAVFLLVRDKALSQRIKAARVRFLQEREAYNSAR